MAGEHELSERLRGRDASAFEAFYRDNATKLCACWADCRAAEDVMHETVHLDLAVTQHLSAGTRLASGISLRHWAVARGGMLADAGTVPEEQPGKHGEERAEVAASVSALGDGFRRLAEEQRSMPWRRSFRVRIGSVLPSVEMIPSAPQQSPKRPIARRRGHWR